MIDFTVGPGKLFINHRASYLAWVVSASISIRIFMSALRTIQLFKKTMMSLSEQFLRDFFGCSVNPKAKDYFVPFFIGTMELAVYPVLITAAAWVPLGGWLTMKTAAAWRWQVSNDSEAYMRFLLGNALVLFVSFLLSRMVKSS
jgi:hypothetical protein